MDDIDRFLREDLGRRGDVTSRLLFGTSEPQGRARLYPREPIVAAGVAEAASVFERLGARVRSRAKDGSRIPKGRTLVEVDGALPSLLAGERLALNFLARMSGIATLTRRIADRVHRLHPACDVAATRKTTPGFRAYEKRAVVLGGGVPHRIGLFDGILIKDNHVAALGGTAAAVARAVKNPYRLPVEVEASDLRSAREAVAAGADWVLLDNLAPTGARRIAEALRRDAPGVRIEVSGGITEENVVRFAAFADRISLGRLTHSAPAADVTMDLAPKR